MSQAQPPYRLLNIHEVLSIGRTDPTDEQYPMGRFSYRVETKEMIHAQAICEANGSNLSEFLRSCIKTLTMEYRDEVTPPPLPGESFESFPVSEK